MNRIARFGLTICALGLALDVHAKTATEVFESVSNSVVIVYGNDSKGEHQSLGSGVVLAGGDVVTNYHVVKDSATIVVKYQGHEYTAQIRNVDFDRDVCRLTVPSLQAPAATTGSSKNLKIGQHVYAIGAPQGLELTLSEGIISSLREVEGGRYIQTSAPISQGSSGGGLFDEDGRLIGLTTFFLSSGQQLNFAVPIEWVEEMPEHTGNAHKDDQAWLSWVKIAIELESKQDWDGLLRHAQQLTEHEPKYASSWLALGGAYARLGKTAQAIEAYEHALSIDRSLSVAWNVLGGILAEAGDLIKAIEATQEAIRTDPRNGSAWFNLGNVYVLMGDPTKAIEAYRNALTIEPDDGLSWYALAGVYGNTGNTADAIHAYEETIRIKPENVDAWYYLGVAYKVNGRITEVMDVYRQLKLLDAKKAEDFFNKFVLP